MATTIARITEISAQSDESFEDAIAQGVARVLSATLDEDEMAVWRQVW